MYQAWLEKQKELTGGDNCPDHESKSATVPSTTSSENQESFTRVALAIMTHSCLTIVGTVSLVVGLATLPISYCVLALHTSSCYMHNAGWALTSCLRKKDGTSTIMSFDGLMVLILCILIKVCAMALLLANPLVSTSKTHSGHDLEKSDWFIQSLVAFWPGENTEAAKYYVGLFAASVAGSAYSLCYTVS